MKTTKIRTLEGAKLVNPIHVTVNVNMDVLKYDLEIIKIGAMNLAGRIWKAAKKAANTVKRAVQITAKVTIENIQYDLEFYPKKASELADAWMNKWWPTLKLDFALLKFNLCILMSSIPLSDVNVGEGVTNVKDQILLLVDGLTKYKREINNDNSDMYQLLLCMMNDN